MWTNEYYEYYVKNAISTYYPEFTNLQKSESPDFISDSCGLEIRRALSGQKGNIDEFIKKYLNSSYTSIPRARLLSLGFIDEPVQDNDVNFLYYQISSHHGTLTYFVHKGTKELRLSGYVPHSATQSDDEKEILNSIIDKTKKLNCIYKSREENILAIHIDYQISFMGDNSNEITDYIVDNTINNIKKEYSNYKGKTFNLIFLVFIDCLVRIDTSNWLFSKHRIDQQTINKIHSITINEIAKTKNSIIK